MHILHKPFVIFIFYLCAVDYNNDPDLEQTLQEAREDMERAGITGELTTDYRLDYETIPNTWRFSLVHNHQLVFASEFILDKSISPQISVDESELLHWQLKDDFIRSMQEFSVIPFLTRRYSNGTSYRYVRLESLECESDNELL